MQKELYNIINRKRLEASWKRERSSLFRSVLAVITCLIITSAATAQDWSQQGADINGAAGEGIGLSVSMSADGNVIASGANANDVNPGNSKTSVKVREWNGTAWVQKGSTLYAEQAGDGFGYSLSLSADGTVLAVGAQFSNATFSEFSNSGRVYVYAWTGTDWVLRGTELNASAEQENFGGAVSLSDDGSLLAVGVPGASSGGTLRGAVKLYEWTGSVWAQRGTTIVGDTDFENLGTSVSLKYISATDIVLAISGPTYTNNTGLVKIYRHAEDDWINGWPTPAILNGTNEGDLFGNSISLSSDGTRLAVGAPTDGIFTLDAIGYVRVFDFSGSWAQVGANIVSDLVYDTYGERLALSGDGQYLIIGAKGGSGNENGRAEVFTYGGSAWEQAGSDLAGEAENDGFGMSVALNSDGSRLAVGASMNAGGGMNSGHIRVFVTGCTPPAAPTGTATQEFCSGATVAQLSAIGTSIQWYDAASGGTLLTGTTALTNSTIYYASQTISACESTDRFAVTITINTTTAPTGEDEQSFCETATVADLVATGTDIKWYDAAADGSLLESTDVLAHNTLYYASQTIDGCESSTRFAVTVSLNTTAAPISAGFQLFCNEATVADLAATGTGIKWYDAAEGGTLLSGTEELEKDVDLAFYASQTVNGCESTERLLVPARVLVMPAPTGDETQTFCNAAMIADLVVTPIDGNTSISWYTAASGGTLLESTEMLTDGTTYYAMQYLNACESVERLAVTVAVNGTVAAPLGDEAQAFCNAGTIADLVVTGTDIKWYDAATDGSVLESTDEIGTGTYYASQTINGCESTTRLAVTVSLNATAAPTSAGFQLFCNEATVADLAATGAAIKWYDAAEGGTLLSGTEELEKETDLVFYASQTVNGCESTERLMVPARVLVMPAPTGDETQTFCNAATIADLVVTPIDENTSISWYTAASGGTLLESTEALTDGTTYYAMQFLNTCESVERLAVAVTLNAAEVPTGEASQSFCDAVTVADLTATGTDIKWYDAATDGSVLESTTALVSGTKYYASQTLNGCESATRLEVTATVYITPAPAAASLPLFCNEATVEDLTATVTGTDIKWYDAAEGGTALGNSEELEKGVTLALYASQTLNGCESTQRLAVSAGVIMLPAPTGDASQTLCSGATVADLEATVEDGIGGIVKWYTEATAGTLLESTTLLTDGTVYYAEQSIQDFCASTERLAVTVSIAPLPGQPESEITQPTCSVATGVITITAQEAGDTYSFNNGESYQNGNSLSGLAAGEYHLVVKSSDGCVSPAASATINAQPVTPATPVVVPTQPTCAIATGTLTVTVQQAGEMYSFNNGTDYQSSNVKSGLAPGEYQVIIKSADGCSSVATTATVNAPPAIPAAPTGNATQNFCASGTVAQLTATGTAIKWYATETGGTPLAGTTALATGTTYYASQTITCESTNRLAVAVTITVLAAPTGEAEQGFCEESTVAELTANAPQTINWYTTATGGTPLGGTTILASDIYYAGYTQDGCQSPRLPVQVEQVLYWKGFWEGIHENVGLKPDGSLWILGNLVTSRPFRHGTDVWTHISLTFTYSSIEVFDIYYGVKSDGTLWSWNVSDRHGDGSGVFSEFFQVDETNNWASSTLGFGHRLALKKDGTLWALGDNLYGQLGIPGPALTKFTQVGVDKWLTVDASLNGNIGIKEDGTLWAWGENNFGQLGDGTGENRSTPVKISSDKWVKVAAGPGHSLAIKDDGSLWAWGKNQYGQLGDGTMETRLTPVKISSDKWVSVVTSSEQSMGMKEDGSLWVWGANRNGELSGTGQHIVVPYKISSEKWASIPSVGSDPSKIGFGIAEDGTLWRVAPTLDRIGAAPPMLAKPSLSVDFTNDSEPLLTTSGGSEYVWYKDGMVINGANEATYTVPGEGGEGNYAVATVAERGCQSPLSEEVAIYITDLDFETGAAVQFYPNPARESVLVQVAEHAEISVVTMTGDVQRGHSEWLSNERAHRVFVQDLISGMYILQVQQGTKRAQVKFIKQ